jgi:hypothetical protein
VLPAAGPAGGGSGGLPLLQQPRPRRMQWVCGGRLALIAYVDREYEIYAALDPLCGREEATQVCGALRRHLGSKARQAELLLLAQPAATGGASS